MTPQVDLLRARLRSVAIEVTSKCNLRCSYCHKADDVLEAMPGANDDMTDEMIGDLYRYCKETGIKNVTLSLGGETTMLAGWHERIARFLDDPEMQTHMVSNFVRLFTDEDLDALTRFSILQISFDSSDWKMVRKLRGADLRTITYNVIRLRQKARELGRSPFLLVNCTLGRDNIGHVGKLAQFCRELGVDQLLLTEMNARNNPKMPETLDRLTDDEVILLAKNIISAEEALQSGTTALRLQQHLELRIGELMEQIREGRTPVEAAAYFHRSMDTSACHQPWMAPMVGATGKVNACCGGSAGVVGNLGSATMGEIVDGHAYRTLRASILEGRPIVPCKTCSFAHKISFPEFVRDMRAWLGEADPAAYECETQRTVWPGLLGSSEYPVAVENSALTSGDAGVVVLTESRSNGLHRVLIDSERADYTEVSFLARPAGRRRLRLDFAEQGTMVGRAQIVLTRYPKVDIMIGEIACQVTPTTNSWYEVKAALPTPKLFSHMDLSLMREDNAVTYRGDGCSGLDISALRIG